MIPLCLSLRNISYPIATCRYSFRVSFGLSGLITSIVSNCLPYLYKVALPCSKNLCRPFFVLYWFITNSDVGRCSYIEQCYSSKSLSFFLHSWYSLRTFYCCNVKYSGPPLFLLFSLLSVLSSGTTSEGSGSLVAASSATDVLVSMFWSS